jgi:hypothetical protein
MLRVPFAQYFGTNKYLQFKTTMKEIAHLNTQLGEYISNFVLTIWSQCLFIAQHIWLYHLCILFAKITQTCGLQFYGTAYLKDSGTKLWSGNGIESV